ncbi:MAG: MmgE/PrpD family protein [Phenylobacterium sp.]|uniref:MmgE/PrpD family protein n=1 Tax=Phenylobacterium sp. TaxID=1871053 RepID=UPI002733C755|nr:MmgE/PrpD family protein [Phenylobacterium sp.]MDP1641701.1 MmgE/PrpD family protein [Phenylobacterium sp.]MDP3116911.1 MmgE/PrpD family protein [Phenylobacterium sp.]
MSGAETPFDASIPVSATLSAYVAGVLAAEPSAEYRELGRLHVLDTLAAMVACRDLEPAVLARAYALGLSGGGGGPNAATILGTSDKASLVDATFASAMTGHAAEINDFIPSAFVQPGPPVLAAALAVAETRGATGGELLRAVMAGYELAGRMPKALGVGNLRRAGIANHGIGPLFGAATAAAVLLRLPAETIEHVWTYCAQQASGSWQWLLDVEHIEKAFVFAGMGARDGLHAALMAQAGFRGVRGALDHPGGWMRSALFRDGDGDRAYLIDELGTRSELPLTAFKRFPVGGPTQPAVEALLALLPRIDSSQVRAVRIEMPGRWEAFRDAAMPALNLRYLAAIILIDRRLDFVAAQSLARMAQDPQVSDLMRRVEIVHDPDQEAAPGEPRTESARVIVQLTDGRKETAYVPHVLGFPSHPMSPADVEAKAMDLMTPALGEAPAEAVVAAVRGLEDLTDSRTLIDLIRR